MIRWPVTVSCDEPGCQRSTKTNATFVHDKVEVRLPGDGDVIVVDRILGEMRREPQRWRHSALGKVLCWEHAPKDKT